MTAATRAEAIGVQSWMRRAMLWGRWCLLWVPLGIVLHELS